MLSRIFFVLILTFIGCLPVNSLIADTDEFATALQGSRASGEKCCTAQLPKFLEQVEGVPSALVSVADAEAVRGQFLVQLQLANTALAFEAFDKIDINLVAIGRGRSDVPLTIELRVGR